MAITYIGGFVVRKRLLLYLSIVCTLSACSSPSFFEEKSKDSSVVSVMTWNTQTFFDAEIEGSEYADYQNLAKWSKDKYLTRLGRLCEVMDEIDADIVVLEEIENVAVVQDIANQFAGRAWDKSKNWNYACFVKDSSSAIGCGVFSKFELKDMKVHSLCIQSQNEVQPSVRPLLEVTVKVLGKDLVVYVNHWKSKAGGEIASEIWRDWQELVVADTINSSYETEDYSCVVCGDFNRDADEFVCVFDGTQKSVNTVFRGTEMNLNLYSPWFLENGEFSTEIGSYFYEKSWERIDHIFGNRAVNISAFGPRTNGSWSGENNIPNSYKLYSGEGYSDHLPLVCAVSLR